MAEEILLEMKNITKTFPGVKALDGVSLTVRRGTVHALMGENGAGKSTLMKAILGLHSPMFGTVRTGDGVKQKEIGYLPQQTDVQRDFPASVREIVLSGCQGGCGLRPFYNRKEKALAQSLMQKMKIEHLSGQCYRELSGGQQQRVLLARALCATKKILLLDEPVSGLDPKVTNEMYQLIRDLNRVDGITVIMISHDISAATEYASHILHIGKKVFFGAKEEYLKSDAGRVFVSERGGENNG